MISTRFVKIAASGLAIGMSLTGGHPVATTPSMASSEGKQLAIAADAAAKANAALASQNYRGAVKAAEMAVEYAPQDANYRMLLGQAYLGAGRFASAETSFADSLKLSPDNARAALNLALTEIAQGKRDEALSTLGDYREKLAVSDYGLAVGLAGDVEMAIATLENAVRAGGADAKTRQNLALSYAMAGRWSNARVMAMQDLSGSDVNDRIGQWASFVRPGSSYDQVASLLGVKPVAQDAGQPSRLALNMVSNEQLASVEPEIAAPAPVQMAAAEPAAPVFETAPAAVSPAPAPVMATAAAPVSSGIMMGERREVVQPLPASYAVVRAPKSLVARVAKPAPVIRAAALPAKQQLIVPKSKAVMPAIAAAAVQPKPRGVEAGKFVVQLGAFQNASVSRDAWKRMSGRFGLAAFDPANSAAKVNGASFVRLSVGGFATRAEATGICTRIQRAGGTCFVRGNLGDAPAQWVQRGMPKAVPAKPVRVASR
jgi:Flp pilus assembly protein TadD